MPRLRRLFGGLMLAVCLCAAPAAAGDAEALDAARELLVRQVVERARLAGQVTGHAELGSGVLEAIGAVPRHEFVAGEVAQFAYLDMPLPAAHGLRESQPFIVAIMTDLVAPGPRDDVLILGIGGGYHAAVASRLAGSVFCLDLDAEAAASVMGRLDRLGHHNVETRVADPYFGWPDRERQFDAIIIRLAVDAVPQAVLRQLKPGGRLIAPVGRSDEAQDLLLFTKDEDGRVRQRLIMPVLFMRLPGGERI